MLRDKQSDPNAREFIQKKLQAARWLIEAVEQRRNTLLKVAKAIVEHQKAFLDEGPEALEPLKMQQIADRVHVHVTTVSRAVDDKWIQTPRGIFSLKRFFGGGTVTAAGEEVAWDTIKQKLLEIIAKEDKENPLSDDEIVKQFAATGLPIARRTVTKYRKMLHIPSSRQRKEFRTNAGGPVGPADHDGGDDEDE
jgi:RNA polymerase sigma-54 factor